MDRDALIALLLNVAHKGQFRSLPDDVRKEVLEAVHRLRVFGVA